MDQAKQSGKERIGHQSKDPPCDEEAYHRGRAMGYKKKARFID